MSFSLAGTFGAETARGREVHRIFLKNHEVSISMGIHGFERDARQRLLINVDLYVPAGGDEADAIDAVLDYDFLRDAINRLATEKHYDLQETLCRAIADVVLAHGGVLGLRVSTEKPDVYPDSESVGYELTVVPSR